MIVSFRDDWLRDFFIEDVRSKKIPPDLETRLFRKIQMIDRDDGSGFARSTQQPLREVAGRPRGL